MWYWLGQGINKNNVEAYSWATIAHERGNPRSGELLKVLASMMSQTELNEGTRKAQEWDRKHMETRGTSKTNGAAERSDH